MLLPDKLKIVYTALLSDIKNFTCIVTSTVGFCCDQKTSRFYLTYSAISVSRAYTVDL
jgi:hypothetical protein